MNKWRKEVPYTEAFECFKNGGIILVELNGLERKYNNFTQWSSDNVSWQSILQGK